MKKQEAVFNFVVGYPWSDSEPNNLCMYCFGKDIQRGTMKEAEEFLKYVKRQAKLSGHTKEEIDKYGIYVVGFSKVM